MTETENKTDFSEIAAELKEINKRLERLENIPSTTIELKKLAVKDCAQYIFDNFPDILVYRYRHETLSYAVSQVSIDGIFTEFGVFQGQTINHISNLAKDRKVYGFDSFEGLPEAWGGTGKNAGDFNVGGNLPKVNKNVELISGWFSNTIPEWKKNISKPIAFCHVDADLYSSAVTIFTELEDSFRAGTILLFDEYFGYPGWRNGEHKAFHEMLDRTGFQWTPLAVSHMGFVVRLGERA